MGWSDTLLGERARLSVGIVIVEFTTAVQWSVVTSVMPAVVRDLGGVELYGLVFSGFTLAALAGTPAAGRWADRSGPGKPFAAMVGLFTLGTLLAGAAPSMPVLALARVVQGYGAGAQYTIAYGAVAKAYPEEGRARMLALLSAVWILPGLVGPAYGALLAATVGWRWAFFSLAPIALAALLLTLPQLRQLQGSPSNEAPVSNRWAVQLTLGVGLVLAGLTVNWWALPAIAAGLVIAWPALRRELPPGTFRAGPGLPAATAAAFLSYFSFFGAFYFVPLMLTGVRGLSIAQAGLAVSLVTVAWSVSNLWQARVATRISPARLALVGSLLMAVGVAGTALALSPAPLLLSYLSWALAGLGIGILAPTVYLAAMKVAERGSETVAVASMQIGNRLGLSLSGGLGGFSVALAHSLGAPLAAGLAGVFALSLLGALGCLVASKRLPNSA